MSSDIVKGMAAHYENLAMPIGSRLSVVESDEAMRAALLWLADNVSDEMAHHAASQYFDNPLNEANPPRILVEFGGVIAAAIRAAAGGGE
jgi:hypothetical protein